MTSSFHFMSTQTWACRRALLSGTMTLLGLSSALGQTSSNSARDMLASLPTKGYDFAWSTSFSAAPSILHWRFGIDLGDFPGTMQVALRDASALPVANYVGSSVQQLATDIPRPLGPELFAGELRAARDMNGTIVAYRVTSIPAEESAARRLFDFASRIRVEMLILEKPPQQTELIEALAREYRINVALCSSYEALVEALRQSGPTIGACLNTAQLTRDGVHVDKMLADLKDRIFIVELQDWTENGNDGFVDKAGFLKQLYTHGVKPALFVLRQTAPSGVAPIPALRRAVSDLSPQLQPLIADVADQISHAPERRAGGGLPEQKSYAARLPSGEVTASPEAAAAVDAALPDRAIVKPRKPRKLLVLDLNVGYPGHESTLIHNYGLKQLAARTGAFTAVFDNNLENLKYPKIKDYDAVFLNNTVGMPFSDPRVREGLLRYVREGGGLGGLHGASYAALDWPEFAEMLGAFPAGGYVLQEKVWLKLDDPHSPLNAGFGDKELLYQDEYYRFTEPYSRDKLHVLLSIDVDRTDMAQAPEADDVKFDIGREDSDYGVSWIHRYGQGRVFYTVLGHNPTLFSTPQLARQVLAGIQFILGDLPADATPSHLIKKAGN
jgi:type 1 glutamine amidotransferase